MTHDLEMLIPLVVFLLACAGVAFHLRSRMDLHAFTGVYYLGGRSMGGFVLAMTTIAAIVSISIFLDGPNQAWDHGFSWVYLAICQVVMFILTFGALGKKLALIGRKIRAVTIVDVIRHRYHSDSIASIAALMIIVFFLAIVVAQLVGSAFIFQAMTGYSYVTGLFLIGGTAVIITAVGGFRVVAVTDALCVVAIVVGIVILVGGILANGGGYDQVIGNIRRTSPGALSIDGGGSVGIETALTQWLMLGILPLVLPQTMVRVLGAKDTRARRHGMVWGTAVIGAVVIGALSLGVLAHGVLPEKTDIGSFGGVAPIAMALGLPAWLAGICVVGPLAAAFSTATSLLITISSSQMKDLLMHKRKNQGRAIPHQHAVSLAQWSTIGFGALVIVLALFPPTFIWWIDFFAFGGLESAFVWIMVLGLFWKRATKHGALASLVGGALAYCLALLFGSAALWGCPPIVIGVGVSLICMVIGSLASKPDTHPELESVFFPR